MPIYALSHDAIVKEKRKGRTWAIVVAVIAVAVGAGVQFIAASAPMWMLAVAIPFFFILFMRSSRRGLKMLEERLAAYQVIAGPDSIVVKQLRVPDVEIHSRQITRIEESRGTGLRIQTAEKKLFVQIPDGLERYEELKAQVSEWSPVESTALKRSHATLFQSLAILLFVVAFATMWLSSVLWLVIAAGLFVIVYISWGLIYTRRRKDIDDRLKFGVWKILLLVFMFALMLYSRVYALLNK